MTEISKKEWWIIAGLAALTIIAHFINLGLMPLLGDEGIRGTVSFEMIKSGNYIVPTNWGEFYYKKTPLYNWIIALFYLATDSYSIFVLRLPSVLSLFLFAYVIYAVSKNRIGKHAAVLAAFAFVLSGRLLTRDSMLGHIDLFFSLVHFLGFYVIYHYWKTKEWVKLFVISYALAASGVLMKGLPSFLFQGFTLLAWFIYKKDFKRLLAWQHFAGIGVFVLMVGGYFLIYSQYNSLENYFMALYDQSSQRTVVDRAWYEGIVNIFTFPFENFGHLFPTSLILIFAFRKGTLKRWMKDDFLAFTFITLVINLVPYWLSPGYYPRYLFMLYPLAFILGAESFFRNRHDWPKFTNGVYWFFLVTGVLCGVAVVAIWFVPDYPFQSYTIPAVFLILLLTAICTFLWFKWKDYRLYFSLAFLAIFRLSMDFFVLPYRYFVEDEEYTYRVEQSRILLEMTEGEKLYKYWHTPIYLDYAYYLGVGKDEIIEETKEIHPDSYYVIERDKLPRLGEADTLYSFSARYLEYQLYLAKTKPTKD